jgi:hypothetical protein
MLVIRARKAVVHCVADGGASGAGTEEGTSFHVTSLVAISLADHPLRMCDVVKQFATLGLDGHAVGREDAATVWSGKRSQRGALDARVNRDCDVLEHTLPTRRRQDRSSE